MTRRFARVGYELTFFWAHPTFDPALADLELRIYDPDETLLDTLDTTAVAAPLGLYSTNEVWLPPSTGIYTLRWYSAAGGIDAREELIVASHPTGDEDVSIPRKYRHEMATGLVDPQLSVYDSDLNLWGSSPYSVTETAISGQYETDDTIALDAEGYYIFVWETTPGSVDAIEILYVGEERGIRDVYLYLIDKRVGYLTPMEGVTVLVSYTDGAPVDQGLSDSDGRIQFSLIEGTTYVVSIQYVNTTFTDNNFEITPVDPADDLVPDQANRFYLMTQPFPAAFDPVEALDASLLSKMKVDVVDIRGRPLAHYHIMVNNMNRPDTVVSGGTTYLVGEGSYILQTDMNGHAEAYFVRGTQLEVVLEYTSIRRIITVPDSAEFDLMTLVTGSSDPFEIAVPDIPTAPRRAL